MKSIATIMMFLLVGALALSSGCAGRAGRPGPPGGGAADESATNTQASAGYRVHTGDTVQVKVYDEPDISGDFKVSAEGEISHPLLGKVPLEGLTVPETEERLRAFLAEDYLVKPRVSVRVTSSSVRRVMIFGEVANPGMYEIPLGERFTLLQAIAKAGGFTDVASINRVRIIRRNGEDERTIKVKVSRLLRGRRRGEDVELESNDVILVPETIF